MMKKTINYSTLVELMVLVPLFAFAIYVAIYFGEVVLTKINGVVSSRYIADSSDVVDVTTVKDLFRTERGKTVDLSGHYWVGNDSILISQQDKFQGQWPVSETGSSGNVIHEYLIEYGFDVNVSYELKNNKLERKVTFTHPDGGLDLMRYFLNDEADDVIQKILQERITYSNSKLSYDYSNDSSIPSGFGNAKDGVYNKTKAISFESESRSMILLDDSLSRNFYKDISSINRITTAEYDSNSGLNSKLTDQRLSKGSITTASGGNQLNVGGPENLYWSADSQFESVRSDYPIVNVDGLNGLTAATNGKTAISAVADTEEELLIKVEEMEESELSLDKNWEDLLVEKKDYYNLLGL
jgi:hypothetical protein